MNGVGGVVFWVVGKMVMMRIMMMLRMVGRTVSAGPVQAPWMGVTTDDDGHRNVIGLVENLNDLWRLFDNNDFWLLLVVIFLDWIEKRLFNCG